MNHSPNVPSVFVQMSGQARLFIGAVLISYSLALVIWMIFSTRDLGYDISLITYSACFQVLTLFIIFIFSESKSDRSGWLHPLTFFVLFSFINTAVRKTAIYCYGLEFHTALRAWNVASLNDLVAYEAFLMGIGNLALFIGFKLSPNFKFLSGLQSANPKNFSLKSGIFLLTSLFGLILLVSASGNLNEHLLNFSRGGGRIYEDGIAGLGHYVILLGFAAPVAYLLIAQNPKIIYQPKFWLLTIFVVVIQFLAAGRRSSVINPIVMGLMIWSLSKGRMPILKFTLGFLFSLFVLGSLGAIRIAHFGATQIDSSQVTQVSFMSSIEKALQEFSIRSGSGSSVYPILALVPQEIDPLWGTSYLENFYRIIPRQIWPDKPRGIDSLANRTFFGGDWGIPPGVLGEAYWNFQIPGVFLAFFSLGMLYKALASLRRQFPRNPAITVIYVITLFLLTPTQSSITSWLFLITPTFLLIVWCGFFARVRPIDARPNQMSH